MRELLKSLHEDEAGAMSVEKILILALIAIPIIVALVIFRNTIMGWFEEESGRLRNP